jgi:mannobiose 2-epimerase
VIDEESSAYQRSTFERELKENILPFWIQYARDDDHGGIYGLVSNDCQVLKDAPKASVICSRVLWTYSTAYLVFKIDRYLDMAHHAYRFLLDKFWDKEFGGIYWLLDYRGVPISDRKQIYSQAFAIYALSEYYRASGESHALQVACELFENIEAHSYDPHHQGYLEALARDWRELADMRLSARDLNCAKSMNTHLHVMEAYTNLLRVWDDVGLRSKQEKLVRVTLNHIIDPVTSHFKLFFDSDWRSLSKLVSFGHDIEGSWLLVEAAQGLGVKPLIQLCQQVGLRMAAAVHEEGLDKAGGLFYESEGGRIVDSDKHWWVHAEAVVGFYNAYQMSGEERFLASSLRIWDFIETKFIDRKYGEWFGRLNRDGVPYTDGYEKEQCKVGPWKCPYHNARTCFEMLERLPC